MGEIMGCLELLAPAKDKTFGKEAVDHGADAVYIGAERFGARAAAGNSVADIHELCTHAHFYNARVYVALNTLLCDNELESARTLIYQLWDAGVDALIIQDMGLLELDLPPIPLFASTQTDNQTPEKVLFLEKNGFQRVILARELGLDTISRIRAATTIDLEAFVHGALCVCYSGQCYMSAAIGGRSANRGACGQPCRLPWHFSDREGHTIARNRFLLSLKDMNRSAHLAELVEAGVTSFKIEGRLKDLAYVKNITGFYRQKLDALLEERPNHRKAASGRVVFSFTPNPDKTFSRGGTDYFLHPDSPKDIHSFDTPKSRGEAVGWVDKIGPDWFSLKSETPFNNGDGLCFVGKDGRFNGFRINKVGKGGKLYPPGKFAMKKIPLEKGMPIFRNHDQAFIKQLSQNMAQRQLGLSLELSETSEGLKLSGIDEDGCGAEVSLPLAKEEARNPEQALASIKKQLGKLGASPYYLTGLTISASPLFLQAKVLNQLRRNLVAALMEKREANYGQSPYERPQDLTPYLFSSLEFNGNVANKAAEQFYRKRGVTDIAPAFECRAPGNGVRVMTARHCILRGLGQCLKESSFSGRPPFYLENEKGRFQVVFDCKNCEMKIFS
jgi:putative protease